MMDWFQILVIASHISGYPMPTEMPTVQYKSREWFVYGPCQAHRQCSLVGWYKDDGVVYLNDSLSQEDHDMFLLHEFVHYLQDKSGKWRKGHCKDNFYREIEAYRAHGVFAQQYQHRLVFATVPPTSCTVEQWDAP
jgi:hypothetical protein